MAAFFKKQHAASVLVQIFFILWFLPVDAVLAAEETTRTSFLDIAASELLCPRDHFIYLNISAQTKLCKPCSSICSGGTTTYCSKNCPGYSMTAVCSSHISGNCTEEQFFHPVKQCCIDCTSVCKVDKNKTFCMRNCRNWQKYFVNTSTTCGEDAFFYPLSASCVQCTTVCQPDKNLTFCLRNCPHWKDRLGTISANANDHDSVSEDGLSTVNTVDAADKATTVGQDNMPTNHWPRWFKVIAIVLLVFIVLFLAVIGFVSFILYRYLCGGRIPFSCSIDVEKGLAATSTASISDATAAGASTAGAPTAGATVTAGAAVAAATTAGATVADVTAAAPTAADATTGDAATADAPTADVTTAQPVAQYSQINELDTGQEKITADDKADESENQHRYGAGAENESQGDLSTSIKELESLANDYILANCGSRSEEQLPSVSISRPTMPNEETDLKSDNNDADDVEIVSDGQSCPLLARSGNPVYECLQTEVPSTDVYTGTNSNAGTFQIGSNLSAQLLEHGSPEEISSDNGKPIRQADGDFDLVSGPASTGLEPSGSVDACPDSGDQDTEIVGLPSQYKSF